jgi:phage repressor protein C with HTH and peptisase S24 domain
MKEATSKTGERLLKAAAALKQAEGPSDVARLLNVSPQTITNWMKRGVSKDGMLLAQRLIGVNATWIETGEGEMPEPTTQHTSGPDHPPVTEDRDALIKRLLPEGKGNVIAWEDEADLPDDPERVWIDRFDYHFSAGSGVIQWEVREKKALPFDMGYFKALGSKPKDCRLLAVRGDSMEPFLFNRDMFMIDVEKTKIRDGGIYAVYFEDEPLVKQIFKKPGGALILHSYNSTKFPDREIAGDQLEYVKIVGELIYRSGSGPAGGN